MNLTGIEGLTIDGARMVVAENAPLVRIEFCSNSWVKGVETKNSLRSAIAASGMYSYRNEVRDCYIHDGQPPVGPTRYGVELAQGSASLVENNIITNITASVLSAGPSSGTVVGYNYITGVTAPGWMFAGIEPHICHTYFWLMEGNQVQSIADDNVWGSGGYHAMFRNQVAGWTSAGNNMRVAIIIEAQHRYDSVIGNVLGTDGQSTSYEYNRTALGNDRGIYTIGFWRASQPSTSQYDDATYGTLLRGGNYDYATRSVVWNTNVPNGGSTSGYMAQQSLPASLYRPAKPSWFGNVAWPAIGPDVSGGDDPSGHSRKIPARLCYESQGLASGGTFDPTVYNAGGTANQTPVASAQSLSTAEDTAKALTLAASDLDNNPLTYAIVSSPAHGTLSGTGSSRTYTPTANYNGSDSFTFTANDGTATSNVATVTITVTAVNDPPVATAQSVSTPSGTAKAITLSGNDVEGSALAYAIVAAPTHGALTGSGASRTYTPTAGYTGADSFTFTVNDGALNSSAATVSITVAPATSTNLAPTVSAVTATPSPVVATTTMLSATATDDGGEPALSYIWSASGPAAVAFSPNGSNAAKASTATFSKAGSYTLTVTAQDAGSLTGTKAAVVTVNATPTTLSISPSGASVQPGLTVDFNAVVADQFNVALGAQPTLAWSVSGGGTIDANGLFTAGSAASSPAGGVSATTYVVTASAGGANGTALVTVSTASTALADGGSGGKRCGGGSALALIGGLGLMLAWRRRR